MQKDIQGNTPLHVAIARGKHERHLSRVIEELLQQGKEEQLRSRNIQGMTPLHAVMLRKHASEYVALLLLRAGADPHAKDSLGRTPYQWLQRRWEWTAVSKFFICN